jgi:penicillin-binding protein 1A
MTIANNGNRVSGTLAPTPGDSSVAYTKVTEQGGHTIKGGENNVIKTPVISESTAKETKSILETVVTSGTGVHANIGAAGQWGKTGTTEKNGDAWFCGGTEEVTACVWVGYADTTTPMTTLYNGGPVMGGTFPALIWARVVSAWEQIKAEHEAQKEAEKESASGGSTYSPPESTESTPPTEEAEPAPAPTQEPEPATPAPATPAPGPEPSAPESSGAGGGITAG